MIRPLSSSWIVRVAEVAMCGVMACSPPGVSPPEAARAPTTAPVAMVQPMATVRRPSAAPTATAQPAPVASSSRTVSVRHGSISQTIEVNGRVAGPDEVELSLPQRMLVTSVSVSPGQTVAQGDAILETDPGSISESLAEARFRVETNGLRLSSLQMQLAARRRAAQADALDAVSKATSELAVVQTGASEAERAAARGAVVAARTNLTKLETELAQLKAGPSQSELQSAQQQVAAKRLALQVAEADKARLLQGTESDKLKSAERELAAARAGLASAESDLTRLSTPDPFEIQTAERAVERAQNGVKQAEGTGDSNTRAAAVSNANLAVQDAQDRLAKLRRGSPPDVIAAAQSKVEDAKFGVAAAQQRLATLRKPPSELNVNQASGAVDAARSELQIGEGRLKQLQSGSSADQLAIATSALESARLSLQAAEARLDEVTSHPTDDELSAAQAKADTATAALNQARRPADASDPAVIEVSLMQKSLEHDRGQVAQLETNLEATRMRAPVAGIVVSVAAHAGEQMDSARPAVVLTTPGDPIVVAAVANSSAGTDPGIAVGQSAIIQLDGGQGPALPATVQRIDSVPASGSRLAKFSVQWGPTLPALGATALAQVTIQEKQDALLLPSAAVRSAGTQKYVELLDGNAPKVTRVDVGLSTPADIEILAGIREDQLVLIGGPAT